MGPLNGVHVPLLLAAAAITDAAKDAFQQGEYEQAAAGFQKALAIEPKDEQLWTHLADCWYAITDYHRAENCYRHAIKLKADFLPAMLGLSETLSITRRPDEAFTILQEATLLGRNADIENAFGNCLFQMNKYSSALKHYRKAVDLEPDEGTGYTNMAVCLRQMGRTEEALAVCERAIQTKNHDWAAVLGLATEYLLRGQWEDGWDLYEVRILNPSGIYKRYMGVPPWDGSGVILLVS